MRRVLEVSSLSNVGVKGWGWEWQKALPQAGKQDCLTEGQEITGQMNVSGPNSRMAFHASFCSLNVKRPPQA